VIALLQQNLAPDAPKWFEVIAAGDIVPAKKPAPDIYEYVLQKMGLLSQDCIAIEDSLHGLQAATSVGIKTVITIKVVSQKRFEDRQSFSIPISYWAIPKS
jgi:beta-phosphoglucomutase-like phosphatase (HAD superfamily)